MPGRFCLLLLILAFALNGCATVSEERIAMLESAVLDLQARDMRLASLEDTVASLVARNAFPNAGESAPEETPDLTTRPGPRRVLPDPPATAAAPAPAPAKTAPPPAHTTASAPPPAPAKAASSPAPPPAPKPAPVPAPAKPKNPAQAARLYQAALSTLEAGRPASALGQFQEFLRAYPGHSLAPNAGYWLGECYYSQKQYDSAIIAFKDVVALHPAHDKAAAAMLKAGFSYALLGDAANARFYFEALVKDFPASKPASLARTRLASL